MKTLAERLKHARDLREWTQSDLAVRAEVSTSTIGNIEIGLRKSKGSIPQIAQALGVSYKWLSEGAGDMEPPKQTIDRIGEEMAALRVIYEEIPLEHRSTAMLEAIKVMMPYRQQSTRPSVAQLPFHPAETAPEAPPSLPALSKTA